MLSPRVGIRFIGVAVAAALVGCTGATSDDGTAGDGSVPVATGSITATTTPAPATPAATTPATAAPIPTTTAPTVVPAGVRWDEPIIGPEVGSEGAVTSMVRLGDEIWAIGAQYNGPLVVRSGDRGATWEEVSLAPPPTDGKLVPTNVARSASGRIVITAARFTDCVAAADAGNGYLFTGFCARNRPVVFTSDDDGVSWRSTEPPAMSPAAGTSVVLVDVVATPTGFAAAGTVRGADWHARLWSSPDGENWTLERELRGTDGPASAVRLLAADDTVALLLEDHPCARPNDRTTAGWVLGADWLQRPRVFVGPDVATIVEVPAADLPLPADTTPVTCDDDLTLDRIAELNAATPTLTGAVIGGQLTLLQAPRPAELPDDADDETARTAGSRRLAVFDGASWTPITVGGVRADDVDAEAVLVDVDGRPGLFERSRPTTGLLEFRPILPLADGSWTQRAAERPVVGRSASAAVWIDGTLLVAGTTAPDPFAAVVDETNPPLAAFWASRESTGDLAPCEPGPNADCRFADLRASAGYPDFAGRDLSGIDLSFADLGDADLSGADLSGATLRAVVSGPDATLRAADLTGAVLPDADLADAVDADFTDADLTGADIADASGARFAGAVLARASIALLPSTDLGDAMVQGADLEFLVPPDGAPYEVSLAGLDLTDATIAGVRDGPLLRVTVLDGAIVDRAYFQRTDLTAVDPAFDLSLANVWESSICPDGLPPSDPPIGTCTR